jgi:hypothetical protein
MAVIGTNWPWRLANAASGCGAGCLPPPARKWTTQKSTLVECQHDTCGLGWGHEHATGIRETLGGRPEALDVKHLPTPRGRWSILVYAVVVGAVTLGTSSPARSDPRRRISIPAKSGQAKPGPTGHYRVPRRCPSESPRRRHRPLALRSLCPIPCLKRRAESRTSGVGVSTARLCPRGSPAQSSRRGACDGTANAAKQ